MKLLQATLPKKHRLKTQDFTTIKLKGKRLWMNYGRQIELTQQAILQLLHPFLQSRKEIFASSEKARKMKQPEKGKSFKKK